MFSLRPAVAGGGQGGGTDPSAAASKRQPTDRRAAAAIDPPLGGAGGGPVRRRSRTKKLFPFPAPKNKTGTINTIAYLRERSKSKKKILPPVGTLSV